jgi:hypothetical protein
VQADFHAVSQRSETITCKRRRVSHDTLLERQIAASCTGRPVSGIHCSKENGKEMFMQALKNKALALGLSLTIAGGLLPSALACNEKTDCTAYTIQVGETIDLYASVGLSDWATDNSANVRVDGTSSISPDCVLVTGVSPTAPGEYAAVRHSYSVREGDSWSTTREEDIFWIVVTDDPSTAPWGALTIAPGETIMLSARSGYSDWESEDSAIASLDGTSNTAGQINISPDLTTVTGIQAGETDVVRSYFTMENGVWEAREEVFHITVVE